MPEIAILKTGTCCVCPGIEVLSSFRLEPCTDAQRQEFPDGAYMTATCHHRPGLAVYNPLSITFDECPEWSHTDKGYVFREESK